MTTAATPQTPPQPGDHAPDFSLKSTSGEEVTLSAFRGKRHALVAFFPLAFTSTCTAELCAFSDDYDEFMGVDVAVLPVSVDALPSLAEFKRKFEMRTDLLSDFKREASRAFGVLDEERFMARRSYFLIDRAGVVRYAHVEPKGGLRRENAELLEEIRKLG